MPRLSPALLAATGGGVVAEVMYLAVLTGSALGMMMVYLVPFPLFVVGLAFGAGAALVAVTLATVLAVLVAGTVALPLAFLVTSGVPVLLLVRQALLSRQHTDGTAEWYPAGLLLVLVSGLGGLLVIVACGLGFILGNDGGLEGAIHDLLVQALPVLFQGSGITPDQAQSDAVAEVITSVFPGMIVVTWLLMVIVNGLLAQAALARCGRLRRPGLRMSEVDLPGWTPLVLALTLAGAVLLDGQARYLAINLSIVLVVPFLFAGLAVVHAFAAGRSSRATILVVFYILVTVVAWLVLAVIGLGIIDQWAGLRRRFGAGSSDRGGV